MNSFAITFNSAIATLQICDRQARKDANKVIQFARSTYAQATSEDAIALYQTIWSITVHPWQERQLTPNLQTYQAVVRLGALFGLLAIACGAQCREWCDRLVTWAEECPSTVVEVTEVGEEAIAPAVPPPVAVVPDEPAQLPDPVAQIPATVAQPQKRKRGRPRKQLATA